MQTNKFSHTDLRMWVRQAKQSSEESEMRCFRPVLPLSERLRAKIRMVSATRVAIRGVWVWLAIVMFLGSHMSAARARAQLSYDHTVFFNGFGSDTTIWKRAYYDLGETTPVFLSYYVNLKQIALANVWDSTNYAGEVSRIAPTLESLSQNVLVGHSLGSLVARGVFFNSISQPKVAAILTIAAPHQGAPLADNADTAVSFLTDVQRRVNDGISASRLTFFVVSMLAQTGVVGPVSRTIITTLFGVFFYKALIQNSYSLGDFVNLPKLPAFPDLRTTSPTIQYLNSHFEDGAVPRANVFGIIPFQYAALRIQASLNDEDRKFGDAVNARNSGVTGFKICKYVGYATIIMSGAARRCAYAIKVLERVDERWVRYTIGTESNGSPRFRDFDGLVPNERSVYPSTNGIDYNVGIAGVDHFNIYTTRVGLYEVARAMQHLGMQPENVVPEQGWPVNIGGSNTVPRCGTVWTANPTGGTAPYTYSWYVGDEFYDTGSDNTIEFIPSASVPSGTMTVRVNVVDSQGKTGGGTKIVSVDPPGNCY